MALVPFPAVIEVPMGNPVTPQHSLAHRTAISQLRAALDGELPSSHLKGMMNQLDPRDLYLARLGDVTAHRIQLFAPDAPQSVRDEALIRCVGWLEDTRGATRIDSVSGLNVSPAPVNSSGWFRQSGAMSLLSPWRVKTSVLIQEDDED